MNLWLTKITIWLVCIAAIIIAPLVGTAIGSEDYFSLFGLFILLVGLFYLCNLHRYTWQFALFITSLGFIYAPAGFKISPDNICMAMLVALFAIFWWRKNMGSSDMLRQNFFFLATRGIIIILLVYGSLHFYFFLKNPPDPANYSWKNSIKTYLTFFTPFFTILYSLYYPKALPLGKNPYRTICRILFVTISIGIAIRLYCLLIPNAPFVLPMGEGTSLLIPGINLLENPHTLRWLGPFTVLMSGIPLAALSKQLKSQDKLLMTILLILGIFSTCLSGGRTAVILSLSMVFFILFLLKKFNLLVISIFLGFGLIITINIFPNIILNENTPLMVKRSLVLLIFDKSTQETGALASINSSTEWRKQLFMLAVEDWQSNSRNFWVGRDVYSYDERDIIAIEVEGFNQAVLESSLRRGSTHTFLTDLLVTYGLIGCVLYILAMIMTLVLLMHFYRRLPKNVYYRPLLLSAFLYFLLGFVYVALYSNWLVALAIVGINQFYNDVNQQHPKQIS
jgi:hypothetical protein